jgi:hypothetical protein
MPWIIFGLGVLVGTGAGVVIVALCQMASSDRHRRNFDCQSECRYDALQSPLLAKHAD